MSDTPFRPKIAYLTVTDPNNKHAWSGTHYYMWKALQANVGNVDLIGPVKPFWPIAIGKLLTGLSQKILGKRYNYRHSKFLAKGYARIAEKRMAGKKYDMIVVPGTTAFIPYLKTEAPIFLIGDATVVNSHNYHKALSNLYEFSWKETLEIEGAALQKASVLLFASNWASKSAINDFRINPDKVFTIPFGSNIDLPPSKQIALNKKKSATCNLLFMGVNWENKGGAIAYEALVALNKMGIDTTLTVCGCTPPDNYRHEKLKVVPFVNKNEPKGFEQFNRLFTEADFFILPTRFEGFGIVFCEASAFGVPSIATDTGGVSSAITEGVNGFLLPATASGEDYARKIAEIFLNDDKYYALVKSSRELYETTLNWDSWAIRVKELYEKKMLTN